MGFTGHASICEAAFHSWKRQGMRKEKKKTWKTISLSILWNIWLERNRRYFEGKEENVFILLRINAVKLKNLAWWNFSTDIDITGVFKVLTALKDWYPAILLYCLITSLAFIDNKILLFHQEKQLENLNKEEKSTRTIVDNTIHRTRTK